VVDAPPGSYDENGKSRHGALNGENYTQEARVVLVSHSDWRRVIPPSASSASEPRRSWTLTSPGTCLRDRPGRRGDAAHLQSVACESASPWRLKTRDSQCWLCVISIEREKLLTRRGARTPIIGPTPRIKGRPSSIHTFSSSTIHSLIHKCFTAARLAFFFSTLCTLSMDRVVHLP
jgi:hypothetical protein